MKFRLPVFFSFVSLLLIWLWQGLYHLPMVVVAYHMAVMVPLHFVVLGLIALVHRRLHYRWHVVIKVGSWGLMVSLFYLLIFGSTHFWGDIVTAKILRTYFADFGGFLRSMPFSYAEMCLGIFIFMLVHFVVAYFFARQISVSLIDLSDAILGHRKTTVVLLILAILSIPLFVKVKRIIHLGGEPLMVMIFDHMWGVTDNPLFSHSRIHAGFIDTKLRKQYTAIPQTGIPKSVIIIIVDALRADHLSAYGYGRNTTPFIDKLVYDGRAARVKHCISTCSCTLCGVPSILLSRTWGDCAVNGFNIIGLLHDRGYQTYALISGAHQEWYNMAKFYSDDCTMYFDGKQSQHYYFKDDRVLLEGLGRVKPMDDTPALFYFHLQSAHETGLLLDTYAIYKPFKKSITTQHLNDQSAINEYDNKVTQADDIIRQLFDALDRKGYLKNSMVVITADHGQGLGEHGISGHVDWLYEPQVSVPLIICDDSLSLYRNLSFARQIDIAPTIIDRLGLRLPSSWMGISLMNVDIAEYSYHETGKSGLETRQAKYMIVYCPDSTHYSSMSEWRDRAEVYKYIFTADFGQEELYELTSDPREEHNLNTTDTHMLDLLRAKAKQQMGHVFAID